MQVKKQQLVLDIEKNQFKIGKGVHQSCILSPCLFNFYVEYIMGNAGLDKTQAGIININKFRYADDTTIIRKQKTKELLDENGRG